MSRSDRLQAAVDNLVHVVMELREVEKGDDTGKCLGELISDQREAWGLSLQALADKVGCSKAHLHDLEHGRSRNPAADLIGRLADALMIPPVHLLNAALLSQRALSQQGGLG